MAGGLAGCNLLLFGRPPPFRLGFVHRGGGLEAFVLLFGMQWTAECAVRGQQQLQLLAPHGRALPCDLCAPRDQESSCCHA